MAPPKPQGRSDNSVNDVVERYVEALSPEHKMLVVLKSQLYGGRWKPMMEDLRNRLDGKPYIFKLVNRINEDIERIEELEEFEEMHGVDLSDYVQLGG